MNARDLLDSVRDAWVSDATTSPTREVLYTYGDTDTSVTLNALVGGGNFNQEEKERLDDFQSFMGLKLTSTPKVGIGGDTLTYDGVIYKIRRYVKLASLYTVYCERSRHNGRPSGK